MTSVLTNAADDPGLGCPVEYIDLRGTSREKPAVCKYTGNKYWCAISSLCWAVCTNSSSPHAILDRLVSTLCYWLHHTKSKGLEYDSSLCANLPLMTENSCLADAECNPVRIQP